MPRHVGQALDLANDYDSIYLSPHLDDAILSCAGAIAAQAARGGRVLILTVCAGVPDPIASPGESDRPRAAWVEGAGDLVRARRAEDLEAASRVGADTLWLNHLDAIYRLPDVYDTPNALVGDVASSDPLPHELAATFDNVRRRCPSAVLYAPLGVGRHVDHQATHAAAAALAPDLDYYEDVPYALRPGAVERRLDEIGRADSFEPRVTIVSDFVDAKTDAVRRYRSQVKALFGDPELVPALLGSYAQWVASQDGAYGERTWRRQPSP